MDLIAQTDAPAWQATAEYWLKTGLVYGLGFVLLTFFVVMLMYFTWRLAGHVLGMLATFREWIPKVFQGHLTFIDKTNECNERTTEAVEILAASKQHDNDAAHRTANALEAVVGTLKSVQSEISGMAKLQVQLNDKIDSKAVIAIQTENVNVEDRTKQ